MALWRGTPAQELPKARQRKRKNKKDDGGANYKCTDVRGGHIHIMFMSLVDVKSGIYFSGLVKDGEFTWHQFHVEGRGA